jgi:serine/threonine protein kinase
MSDEEWDNDDEYNFSEKKSTGSSNNNSSRGESEEDNESVFDEEVSFQPYQGDVTPVISLIRVDPSKTLSEKKCNSSEAPISKDCLSRYSVGKEIARGSQAVIFEGCEKEHNSCPYIIRILLLMDDGNKSVDIEQHVHGQQFLKDIHIRRYISCHCPQLSILELKDAFICRKSPTDVYGISVSPRLSGNLLDYIYSHNNPTSVVGALGDALTAVVDMMHNTCFVVHRDISYQNILFEPGHEGKNTTLYITDFEQSYVEPPETRNKTSQIYDSYKTRDQLSVKETIHELTVTAQLLEAKNQKDDAKVMTLWHQLSSFVKSDLIRRDSHWMELDKSVDVLSRSKSQTSMSELTISNPSSTKEAAERKAEEIEALIV